MKDTKQKLIHKTVLDKPEFLVRFRAHRRELRPLGAGQTPRGPWATPKKSTNKSGVGDTRWGLTPSPEYTRVTHD